MKYIFEFASTPPRGMDARKSDGRGASQVRVTFRSASIASAIRLRNEYGYNRHYIANYCSVDDHNFTEAPVDDYPPDTIFVMPLDTSDPIDGTKGWRVWTGS